MCGTVKGFMKGKARLESQKKLHKIMVVPAAIYGIETWIMRENHETRIQSAKMKFMYREAECIHTDHH
jgi:hypothetical protein